VSVYGVNLPWLHGSYGHDLAENEHYPDWGYAFDTADYGRPLREAGELGFGATRIWLCEYGEGLVTDSRGRITGLHPALLENVARLSEVSAKLGQQVYWTLLDANSVPRSGDALTCSILADRDQTARFAELVAAPIARALDPRLTFAVEALNEPEVLTPSCAAVDAPSSETPSWNTLSWETVGRALRTIGDAVRAELAVPVTAGTMHVFLDSLWQAEPHLDAVDVHIYHDNGGLPPAAQLAALTADPRVGGTIPVFAGECGLPEEGTVPPAVRLAHYLYNAEPSGYAAVFLWRLEGFLVQQDASRRITNAGQEVREALMHRIAERSRQ